MSAERSNLSIEAEAILAELHQTPRAVDHMADHLGFPLEATRRAFRELVQADRIVDVGDRTETPTYKFSIVWHPAPK